MQYPPSKIAKLEADEDSRQQQADNGKNVVQRSWWVICALWTGFTLACVLLGLSLAAMAYVPPTQQVGMNGMFSPFIFPVFLVLVISPSTGLAQTIVLYRILGLKRWGLWLLVTIVGLMGTSVATVLLAYLGLGGLWSLILGVLIISATQGWVLSTYTRSAAWWTVASIIGWAAGIVSCQTLRVLLYPEEHIGSSYRRIDSPLDWPVALVVGVLIYGVVTGGALVWIARGCAPLTLRSLLSLRPLHPLKLACAFGLAVCVVSTISLLISNQSAQSDRLPEAGPVANSPQAISILDEAQLMMLSAKTYHFEVEMFGIYDGRKGTSVGDVDQTGGKIRINNDNQLFGRGEELIFDSGKDVYLRQLNAPGYTALGSSDNITPGAIAYLLDPLQYSGYPGKASNIKFVGDEELNGVTVMKVTYTVSSIGVTGSGGVDATIEVWIEKSTRYILKFRELQRYSAKDFPGIPASPEPGSAAGTESVVWPMTWNFSKFDEEVLPPIEKPTNIMPAPTEEAR